MELPISRFITDVHAGRLTTYNDSSLVRGRFVRHANFAVRRKRFVLCGVAPYRFGLNQT